MRPKNLEKEKAIRTMAMQIIANEGLENLSMQKLAKAANISPRTIYIKYTDKEDMLVKLYIEEVLEEYEKACMENFNPDMEFAEGMQKIWLNAFGYLKNNKHVFALMQYGKSSPLLNKAYQEKNIKEGDYFKLILKFLTRNVANSTIKDMPQEVHRALLFSPVIELVNEYFDYQEKPKQIINEKVISECCNAVIKGILK